MLLAALKSALFAAQDFDVKVNFMKKKFAEQVQAAMQLKQELVTKDRDLTAKNQLLDMKSKEIEVFTEGVNAEVANFEELYKTRESVIQSKDE